MSERQRANHQHSALPLQVAFLTGQSDPRSCALTPAQAAFLDALPVPDEARVRLNFPYDPGLRPYRPVPLWLASWRHVELGLRMRRRSFARHRSAVLGLLERADRTLLLAGSIGLEILGRLDLPADALGRLHVLAYGPVAWRPPRCATLRVRGRRDVIARWWPADTVVDSDHLGYLDCPDLARICREQLAALRR